MTEITRHERSHDVDRGLPPPDVIRSADPVCGILPGTGIPKGHADYFCSGKCREKFIAEPANYLKPET